MSSLNAILGATATKSDELRRTLAEAASDPSKIGSSFDAALSQFQTLSQQLGLLQAGDGDRRDWTAAFEGHFVLPSSVEGIEPAMIPQLLSTKLDKEQEDDAAHAAREALGQHSLAPLAHAELDRHNGTLRAAQKHLLSAALDLQLPGALELLGGKRAKGASRVRSAAVAAAGDGPAAAHASGEAQAPADAGHEAKRARHA